MFAVLKQLILQIVLFCIFLCCIQPW